MTFTEYGDELQKMCSEETGKAGGLLDYAKSILARQGIALEAMTINKIFTERFDEGGQQAVAMERVGAIPIEEIDSLFSE